MRLSARGSIDLAHSWSCKLYKKNEICKKETKYEMKKQICKQKFVRRPKFGLITQRPPAVGSNLHLTGGVGQRTPLPLGRKTGRRRNVGYRTPSCPPANPSHPSYPSWVKKTERKERD